MNISPQSTSASPRCKLYIASMVQALYLEMIDDECTHVASVGICLAHEVMEYRC